MGRLRTTTTMMRAMKCTEDNNMTVKFVSSVVYFEYMSFSENIQMMAL